MESFIIKKKNTNIDEQYIKIEHKSGMEVYILPKKMSTTNVMLAAKCGSGDNAVKYAESDSEQMKTAVFPDGIAHFVEHKLFAEEDGTDLSQKLARVGANCNAFTAFDKTAYTFTTRKSIYDALKILIKGYFSPYFTRENVETEKSIIAEEIKMYNDDPADSLFYQMMSSVFSHPYIKTGGCGTLHSIKNITPKMLSLYHYIFYRPENTVLCICGEAEPHEVMNLLDLTVPCLPPIKTERVYFPEKQGVTDSFVTKPKSIATPILNVGIKFILDSTSPIERMKQLIAINILSEHYFSSSNPYIASFYEKGLVNCEIKFGLDVCRDRGVITLYTEGKNAKSVGMKLRDYIGTLNNKVMSSQRAETLKKVLYTEYLTSFDSTMDSANELLSFSCDGFDIFDYPKVLSSLDINFINSIAKTLFTNYNVCVAVGSAKQGR